MSIHLDWYDDDKRKLHIRFDGIWTLDDFQKMTIKANEMIETQSHIVHVIVDLQNCAPPSTAILPGVGFAVRHFPMDWGVAVVLSNHRTLEHLVRTVMSMYPSLQQRIYVVKSLEIGERIITHYEKQRNLEV